MKDRALCFVSRWPALLPQDERTPLECRAFRQRREMASKSESCSNRPSLICKPQDRLRP